MDAAGSWMQAGLPLKCIKLVIYGDDDSNLNKLFSSMKEKLSTKFEKKLKVGEASYIRDYILKLFSFQVNNIYVSVTRKCNIKYALKSTKLFLVERFTV